MNRTEVVESVEAYVIRVVRFPLDIDEAYTARELKFKFSSATKAAIPVESVENPFSIT
jgi:hypothetical protein